VYRTENPVRCLHPWQTDITLESVRVPEEARLEGAHGFRDMANVLFKARYLVAWEEVGHATACYEAA
jgi:glutaryl-CoA dehydrogenase